jgi:hypothetical protein
MSDHLPEHEPIVSDLLGLRLQTPDRSAASGRRQWLVPCPLGDPVQFTERVRLWPLQVGSRRGQVKVRFPRPTAQVGHPSGGRILGPGRSGEGRSGSAVDHGVIDGREGAGGSMSGGGRRGWRLGLRVALAAVSSRQPLWGPRSWGEVWPRSFSMLPASRVGAWRTRWSQCR